MTAQSPFEVSLSDVPSAESTYREGNGIELHAVTAGDENDPLVVLLHGMPEFWYSWRRYIEPLVDAGYRVLVPDQRGYNASEKPPGVSPYRVTELAKDVVKLVETEGRDSAHIVGHDWGGLVAWEVAMRHPETVDTMCVLNAPHPTVFHRGFLTIPKQMKNSWYIFYYQLPRLPEWVSSLTDFKFWTSAMQDTALPDTFSETDMQCYRMAWEQAGAETAMINWYRAVGRYYEDPPREQVTAPTLIIWGEQDHALIPELAAKSVGYCDDGRLVQFSDATHWITHEYPDRVLNLLLEQLEDHPSSEP